MNKNMSLPSATALAAVIAAIFNGVTLYGGRPLVGSSSSFMPLSLGPVIAWSVVGSIGAGLVYAVVRKFARNPQKAFAVIAFVVLVLSFIPDYLVSDLTSGPFAGGTLASSFLLMLMHVIAAGIILCIFLTRVRPVSSK